MTNYEILCSKIFVNPDKGISVAQFARDILQVTSDCTKCPVFNYEAKVCRYPGQSCLQKMLFWLHEDTEEEKKMTSKESTTTWTQSGNNYVHTVGGNDSLQKMLTHVREDVLEEKNMKNTELNTNINNLEELGSDKKALDVAIDNANFVNKDAEQTSLNSVYITDNTSEIDDEWSGSLSGGGKKGSGYYEDEEGSRFGKLLHAIFKMCDAAGYDVKGRIVLKDRKTGRIHQ